MLRGQQTSPRGPLACPLTTQRSRRLVSLAVRTVTLVGATSGGACSVWMTREDGLKGLAPATFTCRIRNLEGQSMVRVTLQQKKPRKVERQRKTGPQGRLGDEGCSGPRI